MPKFKLKTNGTNLSKFDAKKQLLDKSKIQAALIECILEGDAESFKEILKAHLEAINLTEFSKDIGIPRRTLYNILSPEGNPSFENVCKIINKICA